jgi:phosphoglycolate phosphatase
LKRLVVVFDLDGPLLDVSERYHRLYADLLRARGLRPLAKRTYWRLKRRRIPEEAIFRRSGGAAAEAREYARRRSRLIESREYLRYDRAWPRVSAVLRHLEPRSQLLLATARRSHRSLTWQLERIGIGGYFHRVLAIPPAAASRAEAKAASVREALVEPSQPGWFVGDTETDLRAGRLLGFRTAAVSFGIRRAAELRQSAPDKLLETPAELLAWARSSVP